MKIYNNKLFMIRLLKSVLIGYFWICPFHISHIIAIQTYSYVGIFICAFLLTVLLQGMLFFVGLLIRDGIENLMRNDYILRWIYWLTAEGEADKFVGEI